MTWLVPSLWPIHLLGKVKETKSRAQTGILGVTKQKVPANTREHTLEVTLPSRYQSLHTTMSPDL